MRFYARIVVWAILVSQFLAISSVAAGDGSTAHRKEFQMPDLALTLQLPHDKVLAGENFEAEVTICNVGETVIVAPEDFGDDDYRFELVPVGGGDTIVITRQAFEDADRPGEQVEQLTSLNVPITKELAAGESRVALVYPARLRTNPVPVGIYDISVSLISAPEVVSTPVRLTVEAPNIVRLHITGGGPESGSGLTYVHRDGSGAHHIFGGTGVADAPTWIAGLRIAQITDPIESLNIAHAVHIEDESGPLMLAWLSNEGILSTAVSQSAYVVAVADPINLDLESAMLAPTGWKTGDLQFAASFAVLGIKDGKVELALISLGRDTNWIPTVQRIPLPLSKMPAFWRISQSSEDGFMLLVGDAQDNGAHIFKLAIGANNIVMGEPTELLSTTHPLVALSAPLVATEGAKIQALTGPSITERGAVMNIHFIPIDGGPSVEKRFVVPVIDGAPPSDWSLAEGAPAVSAIVVHSGTNILGLRYNETDIKQGKVLAQDIPSPNGLSAIVIGNTAWAVWLEGTQKIESIPFPR